MKRALHRPRRVRFDQKMWVGKPLSEDDRCPHFPENFMCCDRICCGHKRRVTGDGTGDVLPPLDPTRARTAKGIVS